MSPSARGGLAADARRRAFASSPPPKQPKPQTRPVLVNDEDLDAWANGPTVLGHVYSRPSSDPYELSTTKEHSGGEVAPDGWMLRLMSAAGLKSTACNNQDSFSYTLLESGWVLTVVCDGHGENGDMVSERIARSLPMFICHHMDAMGFEKALTEAFLLAQADLEQSVSPMQAFSGATVAVCCNNPTTGEVWVAHAGDSIVVIGDLATGQPLFHTGEHKAHDPEEAKRLEECGAQVICKKYEDGETVSRVFIPRTGVPGLAMSRSLGDGCLKKYGVTALPDVQNISGIWEKCTHPICVIGSDGLFDTISVEDTIASLAARIRAGHNLTQGVLKLIRRSQHYWIEEEGDYCDDITLVMVGPKPVFDDSAKAK